MPSKDTKTTVEYPLDEFRELLKEKLFGGLAFKVEFVIEEVGGDRDDRYGRMEVTKVRFVFDGVPSSLETSPVRPR